MRSKRGFTLVELMVVILIVAILAAVAIPILRGRIDDAKWSEGRAMMGSIATSIRAWCAEKGPDYDDGTDPVYPLTLADLGFYTNDLMGTYFEDTDFSFSVTACGPPPGFTVVCTPTAKDNHPGVPATYTLTGSATTGESTWDP